MTAKDNKQLDISIKNIDKIITNDKLLEEFIQSNIKVSQKIDGIKINIIKINNTGRAEDDYLVSYKNNIIFSDEHTYLSSPEIRLHSISNSQFQFIWSHLKKLRKNKVPINTEMFVEFVMKKPTLSSNYTDLYKMVLLGYSSSEYFTKQGKLISKNSGFETIDNEFIANEMILDLPNIVFEGSIKNKVTFSEGIKDQRLKKLYRQSDINWDSNEDILNKVKTMFLGIDSVYGGKEEGVVIEYFSNTKDKKIVTKIVQDYQYDKEKRYDKASQFKGSLEYENAYWKKVQEVCFNILKGINNKDMQKSLSIFSKELKNLKINIQHEKKTKEQIKEDIQITARMILAKKLSSGALIIGKFRILTSAHYKMIKEALAKYDTVTVNIVSNKETKSTKELRNKIIKEVFPEVEILNSQTGNIYTIMRKSVYEITTIIAGSDRFDDYSRMLENNIGMKVFEIQRKDSDISATKVINNLHSFEYFKENTPTQIEDYYGEYLNSY